MFFWDLKFQVTGPSQEFPHIHNYTVESRRDPSYYCECRRRKDPTCLMDLTLEGRGFYRDASGEHEVSSGKAFLCVLNNPEVSYYYPPDGREPWTFLWICFSGANSAAMLQTLIDRHGPICEMPIHAGLIGEILALRKGGSGIRQTSPAASAKMVMDLLAAIESSMLSKPGPDDAKDALVMKAQSMALERLESGISVASIATELGVSREHLSRVFKERCGLSLADWLLRRRMQAAARLLKDNSLSCKEIAWRLGYESPTNFSRAFVKCLGIPPLQFRRSGSIPAI